jgi:hypothetical protein
MLCSPPQRHYAGIYPWCHDYHDIHHPFPSPDVYTGFDTHVLRSLRDGQTFSSRRRGPVRHGGMGSVLRGDRDAHFGRGIRSQMRSGFCGAWNQFLRRVTVFKWPFVLGTADNPLPNSPACFDRSFVMNETTPPTSRVRPAAFLFCHHCRTVRECAPTEMLAYTRHGWPLCCDEVMTLYSRSDGPLTDDTKIG